MYKFVAVFALLVITFWGCNEDMNKTGFDLLLPGDLVSVRKISIPKELIEAYTVKDQTVKTSNPTLSLLGTFNDSIFGKTTTDFAYQFRLLSYHDLTNATADSLILTLVYKETYGDTVTSQSLKVYELNKDLDPLAIYDQNTDLKDKSKSEVVAQQTFVPKFQKIFLNSAYDSLTNPNPSDTLPHVIRFHLSDSLRNYLKEFKAPVINPSGDNNINDVFLQYFKGLYVEAGDLNLGGAIVKVERIAKDADSTLLYTQMKLYCHTYDATKDTIIKDSIIYYVADNSARVGHFDHDYLTAKFAIDKVQGDQQDSAIYLQTTGGLSDKIYIPSLNNWSSPDSSDCAINKAELIFEVDKSKIDTILTPAPQKLLLSLIAKIDGKEVLVDSVGKALYPRDLSLSEAYYDGTYNKKAGTYRFNLAKHLQDIIKNKEKKYEYIGFYLFTMDNNAIFRRVVLRGSSRIHFNITYTNIKK